MQLNKLLLTIIIAGLALTQTGCFTSKKPATAKTQKRYKLEQDVPPHHKEVIPDISKIPNAAPKLEPKSRYGNPKTYTVFKKSYQVMPSSKGYKARGKASWYGKKFHGYRTSSGDTYDMYAMSAAHKTLPLPTYAKVTNVENGKSVIVKINDRGPFHEDRLIDLSYAAASKLGLLHKGTGNVEIHAIDTVMEALPLPRSKRYLQIGSFNQVQKAKQMAANIEKVTKSHPIQVRQNLASKDKLYHVHIGPLKDHAMTNQLKKKLIAHKFPKPVHIELK